MELFIEINAYHWFALGLVLFAAEALGAAGFLLGAAAAAIVIGVLSLFAPDLDIAAQFSLYALVALVARRGTIVLEEAFGQLDPSGDAPP